MQIHHKQWQPAWPAWLESRAHISETVRGGYNNSQRTLALIWPRIPKASLPQLMWMSLALILILSLVCVVKAHLNLQEYPTGSLLLWGLNNCWAQQNQTQLSSTFPWKRQRKWIVVVDIRTFRSRTREITVPPWPQLGDHDPGTTNTRQVLMASGWLNKQGKCCLPKQFPRSQLVPLQLFIWSNISQSTFLYRMLKGATWGRKEVSVVK